jgi:sarcosine/dimethylglycine N-methyltransferase
VTYTETDLVATIERLAGADLGALTQLDRDRFHQYHSGGSEAVDRLLPSLHRAPERWPCCRTVAAP